jgi:hypothetical protein
MTGRIVVPHFATESEEADWRFANRQEHDEIMAKAMDAGRAATVKDVLERHGLEAPGAGQNRSRRCSPGASASC